MEMVHFENFLQQKRGKPTEVKIYFTEKWWAS
jgi:hypothetical protein